MDPKSLNMSEDNVLELTLNAELLQLISSTVVS